MLRNKQKKKILFYCPFINKGGIETNLLKYTNFLTDYYSVYIYTNSFSNRILSKINKKVKVMNIKNKFYLRNRILNDFMVYKSLKKNLDQKSIIFSLQDHFFILILNFLFSKSKIIIRTSSMIPNQNNYDEQKHLKNLVIKKIFLGLYRLADEVITFSKNNVEAFSKRNIKSVCIYNYFKKKEIINPKINQKFNIFYIGRFTFDKDPKFFLNNLLKFKNINIHLVGDGIEKKDLKKIANKQKNIFFHNFINNPFKKFKHKIHLLCITSLYDGTPNVMGEAMSFGIPVLAPKNVGSTNFYLKNGKLGYLYKNENSNSFKKKISEILSDYKRAKKKAIKGYHSMSRFNKEKTLFKLLGVIKKL